MKVTREEIRLAQKEVLQRLLLYILWQDVRDLDEVKKLVKKLIENL